MSQNAVRVFFWFIFPLAIFCPRELRALVFSTEIAYNLFISYLQGRL